MHNIEAKSILSPKNGMNIYRGCSHGCIYCDSRSECYGMTDCFEDIGIKYNAPMLLENALKRKRSRCMIGTGSMTDPYVPIEKTKMLTRKCLEIIERYGFGFTCLTKSDLILRDLDLLQSINKKSKCVVQMTLTTYDENLCKIIEPNVATTKKRFEVLKAFKEAKIPTIVWITPILPFINDNKENIAGLLNYCMEADVKGILTFGIGLTLRDGSRDYFYKMLDNRFPKVKEEYIKHFGNSYIIESANSYSLNKMVENFCVKNNLLFESRDIFDYLNKFEEQEVQLSLF